MLTHSDFCEDRMPYYTPFPSADKTRGRVSLRVTHHRIGADLDRDQLDKEAPLTDRDSLILAQYTYDLDKEPETHQRVVARIHAVQRQLWGKERKWRDD